MRKIYCIVLAIIGVIISYYIVTAFVLQQQAVNKQSIYVHLQPDWKSYPGNIEYEITNVWSQQQKIPLSSKERLELSKQNNVDEVRSQHNKQYILVHNSNSNCRDSWEPHYARFGADTLRHYIEYVGGLQKNPDPNITLYTLQHSREDRLAHESEIKTGYAQFIPVCASKNNTSFDYTVKINDKNVGFDVYFVPSSQQNYLDENFEYYQNGECYGKNYERFSGTCNDVGRDSGLLIILPDTMKLPLTKVEVWLYEKSG